MEASRGESVAAEYCHSRVGEVDSESELAMVLGDWSWLLDNTTHLAGRRHAVHQFVLAIVIVGVGDTRPDTRPNRSALLVQEMALVVVQIVGGHKLVQNVVERENVLGTEEDRTGMGRCNSSH